MGQASQLDALLATEPDSELLEALKAASAPSKAVRAVGTLRVLLKRVEQAGPLALHPARHAAGSAATWCMGHAVAWLSLVRRRRMDRTWNCCMRCWS